MSEPPSCAMDADSPVSATSRSMCGRAMSHNPSAPTEAMPSVSTVGGSPKPAPVARTKPSSSRVSSSRRAVGRASPAAVATSDSDIVRWPASKQVRTSRPRASASTKSGPAPRPAIGDLSGRPRPGSRPESAKGGEGGVLSSAAEDALFAAGPLRLVDEVAVLVRVVEDRRLGGRHLGEHPGLPDLVAALLLQVVDRVLDLRAHRREVDADELPVVLHDPAVHDDGVHVAALRLERHVPVGVEHREGD